MERWAGRVAVVTGASAGIGAAIAAALVRAGLRVVGLARRDNLVQSLSVSLRAEGARGELVALRADVSSEQGVREAYAWVDQNLGGVSVCVNCAAIGCFQPLLELDAGTISSMVGTNIEGLIHSCREAVLSMKRHGILDGHVININSIAGHQVPPYSPFSTSVYAGTKFAVTAFCKGLRRDLKRMEGFRIRVSSVSPGGTDTDMLPDGYRKANTTASGAPAYPLLQPEDVAGAVLYALGSSPTVEICELTITPTGEGIY